MMKKALFLLVISQLIILPYVYAQEYNAFSKLGRGFGNAVLSFTELPIQMIKTSEESGDAAGFFVGIPKGLAFWVGRCALGFYEAFTFIIPPYGPLVKPEFPCCMGNEEER